MPTYTYECRSCEHSFDLFHAMSARPRVKCPECGGGCKRLVGKGSGVIFKGSGFYETDYKGKSSSGGRSGASDSKSEGASSSKSESKSETKTESKTETKSETKSESKSDTKSSSKPPSSS